MSKLNWGFRQQIWIWLAQPAFNRSTAEMMFLQLGAFSWLRHPRILQLVEIQIGFLTKPCSWCTPEFRFGQESFVEPFLPSEDVTCSPLTNVTNACSISANYALWLGYTNLQLPLLFMAIQLHLFTTHTHTHESGWMRMTVTWPQIMSVE